MTQWNENTPLEYTAMSSLQIIYYLSQIVKGEYYISGMLNDYYNMTPSSHVD